MLREDDEPLGLQRQGGGVAGLAVALVQDNKLLGLAKRFKS